MKLAIRLVQGILILVPVGIFGWLCVQNFVPSGTFVVSRPVQKTSSFIDALQPTDRVSSVYKDDSGSFVQAIHADPVFFFVHPHREFDSVEAEVWFKNEKTPIVELGVLATKDPERYQFKPLQNLLIDQSTWSRLEDKKLILLQRTPLYRTVEDFLKNPPQLGEIATYNTSLDAPFRLPGYVRSTALQTIQATIRGHHEIKTYLKNESLNFQFSFMDMNRDEGSDAISITVFNEKNEPVAQSSLTDDGNITMSGKPSGLQNIYLRKDGLPEGVYKIVVSAPRDIFFRQMVTSQQKIIFLNTVYLGDEVGYRETFQPLTFWTEAKRLSFQTRHAEATQTILIGSKSFAITEPYHFYTTSVANSGLTLVKIQKGDLEIITDAPIAFFESHFFRPDPVRLWPHTDLDALRINYLIANYTPPTVKDGWNVAKVSFDTKELLLDKESWKFSFSTPEIVELHTEVLVKEIVLRFYRMPILK